MSEMRKYVKPALMVLATVAVFVLVMTYADDAWARDDLASKTKGWLNKIGDLLTTVVGPAVLVIGFAACGIMFAMGNENAKRYGLYVAIGGGMITLAGAAAGFFTS